MRRNGAVDVSTATYSGSVLPQNVRAAVWHGHLDGQSLHQLPVMWKSSAVNKRESQCLRHPRDIGMADRNLGKVACRCFLLHIFCILYSLADLRHFASLKQVPAAL